MLFSASDYRFVFLKFALAAGVGWANNRWNEINDEATKTTPRRQRKETGEERKREKTRTRQRNFQRNEDVK